MTETCADCKYHVCNNHCIKTPYCDGKCDFKHSHRMCNMSKCKFFTLDDYFQKK